MAKNQNFLQNLVPLKLIRKIVSKKAPFRLHGKKQRNHFKRFTKQLMKSERLKKLEGELKDLEQWLKLGLVPKSDLKKHEMEMTTLKKKIREEAERLQELKESGDIEEYITPSKRSGPQKSPFQEAHTLSDADDNYSDTETDIDTTSYEAETSALFDLDEKIAEGKTLTDEEDDPFSDKNRWRRGILEDPDANDW